MVGIRNEHTLWILGPRTILETQVITVNSNVKFYKQFANNVACKKCEASL